MARFSCISLFLILVFFTGCLDFFEFDTEKEQPAIIVEGHISDVSSNDYYEKYYEPRYFELKLRRASRVRNVRDENILGAEIELFSKTENEYWDYTEFENGIYQLLYPDFKAVPNNEYQIQIKLPEGNTILSEFEVIPAEQSISNTIDFVETSEFQYVQTYKGQVIKEVEGVDVSITLQESENKSEHYYRWNFLTTWVLKAISIPESFPNGLCWVTQQYFFDEFKLSGYVGNRTRKKLFFLKTSGNRPIRDGFSVRVNQMMMDKNYFQFWEDLDSQKKQAELFAPPAYNLVTNLSIEMENLEVYGYFGVVREDNFDWYFDPKDLSYAPKFTEPCRLPDIVSRPRYCRDCMEYGRHRYRDRITNIEPGWWDI